MTNYDFHVSPEHMQAHIDRANKLRAEAVRASFIDAKNAIKGLFGRIAHTLNIPRTEQL